MKRYLSILLAAVTIFTVSCRKDNTKDNENRDIKASPTMTVTATATPTAEVQPSETPEATADATKSPEPQGGEVLTQTATAEATQNPAPGTLGARHPSVAGVVHFPPLPWLCRQPFAVATCSHCTITQPRGRSLQLFLSCLEPTL